LLYRLSDFPVLEKLARVRTMATHLDGQACRFLYQAALDEIDIAKLSRSERQLFDALIIPLTFTITSAWSAGLC
jgi:hypothetical protein